MKPRPEEAEPVLCARCAWREHCTKRFSFDNTKPVKCPDFSPDVTLKDETEDDRQEDTGGTA
ncbi:MAG TPA: hypothetical protein ENJ40_03600 [Thermosulfurimonas dismutans]|uniref:Uncharacterized protein n=1 Tax=Thermosulfurimonas dismutans TaxID=999894 RepID=A0A7C3CL29_9BACT|nr:hypothetical protein [Thermosulfurimonas dismutans]